MPTFPFARTLILVRPGAGGFGGDPGTPEADRPIPGCTWWPGDTEENTLNADQVTADLTALLPPGTDVLATDQIRDPDDPTVPARLCQIIGSPQYYNANPFSTLDPGIVVRLRRTTG